VIAVQSTNTSRPSAEHSVVTGYGLRQTTIAVNCDSGDLLRFLNSNRDENKYVRHHHAHDLRSCVRKGNLKRARPIQTLFVDVGEVLLTDGWDHLARKRAAKHFKLPWADMDERHRLVFESHEEGRLTFEEYLGWVVFYEKRTFTRTQFRDFMFAQSTPYRGMIELITQLKTRYGLKIVVVSNECRELNAYRIRTFKLDQFVDTFVSSCFVHIRKPDVRIFQLALDLAQTRTTRAVFIDNTPMFVEIAEGLGIHGIVHVNHAATRAKLASLALGTT
jgi:putative hydrolase of the HAD superfamily